MTQSGEERSADPGRGNRRRAVTVAVAVAVLAVIVAGTAAVALRDKPEADSVDPVGPPQVIAGGAVWYDAAGLHHGDVVEQTPVELFETEAEEVSGVLALVRGGALYRDPATDDVWFHPWNGQPRVVGHGSEAGPGGDPAGDVAAWFEGDVLVVYDTAQYRELSRTTQKPVLDYATWEQAGGNGFRHVSAEEVVWRSFRSMHRLDVATGTTSTLWDGLWRYGNGSEDVHDGTRVRHRFKTSALQVVVPNEPERRFPALGPSVELSPDGSFLLAPGDADGEEGAPEEVVNLRTGERWTLPGGDHGYPAIAWSYGAVALLLVDRGAGVAPALACDAVTRDCHELPFDGRVLLPTS